MAEKELTIIELTEENIESMIYEIRGQKVMLDFDLARIYGYTTRDFNNQIKHNIERFDDDFMFRLTKEETKEVLRWKKSTANQLSSKRRYNPYAFTEHGIYMLMTVLKGDLAVKQSKALIRLFEKMKNYIVSSNSLETLNELLRLSNKVNEHDKDINEIKDQLEIISNNFIDPSTYKQFLVMLGERTEAKLAYKSIYSLAKKLIVIVDDYISLKTLSLLKACSPCLRLFLISDNLARDKITNDDIEDFEKETNIRIVLKPSKRVFHDRYILIDCDTENEMLFDSGPSSKDAGNKIGTITRIEKTEEYKRVIKELIV